MEESQTFSWSRNQSIQEKFLQPPPSRKGGGGEGELRNPRIGGRGGGANTRGGLSCPIREYRNGNQAGHDAPPLPPPFTTTPHPSADDR